MCLLLRFQREFSQVQQPTRLGIRRIQVQNVAELDQSGGVRRNGGDSGNPSCYQVVVPFLSSLLLLSGKRGFALLQLA